MVRDGGFPPNKSMCIRMECQRSEGGYYSNEMSDQYNCFFCYVDKCAKSRMVYSFPPNLI